jgi:uncharacterized membrane protein YdjX (TVP38/TMEM64 family)
MTDQTTAGTSLSLRRAIPLLIIAAGSVFGIFIFGDLLSLEALRDNRAALLAWRDENYLTAALAYMLAYVVVVAFSLPGATIMTLTGGFLFGLAAGTSLSVVAATTGAICIFLAARAGLGDSLHARLAAQSGEGMLARMEKGLHENEISFLFLMRLVPVFPFFVANLAPAFLGVSLRNFALTTFFGIIPGGLVYTSIGAGLSEVFARGDTPDLGLLFEPAVIGPILGLAALASLPILIKLLRQKDRN